MEIKNFKMDGTLIDDYAIDKMSGDMPKYSRATQVQQA